MPTTRGEEKKKDASHEEERGGIPPKRNEVVALTWEDCGFKSGSRVGSLVNHSRVGSLVNHSNPGAYTFWDFTQIR